MWSQHKIHTNHISPHTKPSDLLERVKTTPHTSTGFGVAKAGGMEDLRVMAQTRLDHQARWANLCNFWINTCSKEVGCVRQRVKLDKRTGQYLDCFQWKGRNSACEKKFSNWRYLFQICRVACKSKGGRHRIASHRLSILTEWRYRLLSSVIKKRLRGVTTFWVFLHNWKIARVGAAWWH